MSLTVDIASWIDLLTKITTQLHEINLFKAKKINFQSVLKILLFRFL